MTSVRHMSEASEASHSDDCHHSDNDGSRCCDKEEETYCYSDNDESICHGEEEETCFVEELPAFGAKFCNASVYDSRKIDPTWTLARVENSMKNVIGEVIPFCGEYHHEPERSYSRNL